MKKILGCILTVMLLLLVMMIPGSALADTTAVTGQVAATPTITSISPDNGDPGETLTGVLIIGTDFEAGAAVSFNGTGVTAANVTVVTSTNITANITIDAGATTGLRDVIVTQGGKTGTGAGLFTVNAVFITVTAPSAISLGLMTAGSITTSSSSANGTVDTNAASWQVIANDEKGSNTGYMVNGGAAPLTNKFQISKDNVNWDDADTGITYDNVTSLPFYAKQEVIQSDAGGSYTITITFTGSIL
jgi:hypothetical protein